MRDDELRDLATQAAISSATANAQGEMAQARHWESIRSAAQQIVTLRHWKAKTK